MARKGKKILACGFGQQSTAPALMAAAKVMGYEVHECIPVFDAVLFCDLHCEPGWVYRQLDYVADVYSKVGLELVVLDFDLYGDHIRRLKDGKWIKMPLWTDLDGKKGKLPRACTLDYKIMKMHNYVKEHMLGYERRPYRKPNGETGFRLESVRPEDVGAHEMHIGFSSEEQSRVFDSKNPMFKNKFPLIEMGFERKDSYRYCLEEWGLNTKGSSCYICPFHRNYYFAHLKRHYPADYKAVLEFDRALAEKPPTHPVKSDLYLTYDLKRVQDLTPGDCNDAQTFLYNGKRVWNGF